MKGTTELLAWGMMRGRSKWVPALRRHWVPWVYWQTEEGTMRQTQCPWCLFYAWPPEALVCKQHVFCSTPALPSAGQVPPLWLPYDICFHLAQAAHEQVARRKGQQHEVAMALLTHMPSPRGNVIALAEVLLDGKWGIETMKKFCSKHKRTCAIEELRPESVKRDQDVGRKR